MKAQFDQDPNLKLKIERRITTKFSYPKENADVFISYSRSDSAFVEKFYELVEQDENNYENDAKLKKRKRG